MCCTGALGLRASTTTAVSSLVCQSVVSYLSKPHDPISSPPPTYFSALWLGAWLSLPVVALACLPGSGDAPQERRSVAVHAAALAAFRDTLGSHNVPLHCFATHDPPRFVHRVSASGCQRVMCPELLIVSPRLNLPSSK